MTKTRSKAKLSPDKPTACEEDACFVCEEWNAPESSSEDLWICCNSCSRWFHPLCCGLSASDICRRELFKCIFCCLDVVCGKEAPDISILIKHSAKKSLSQLSTKKSGSKSSQKKTSNLPHKVTTETIGESESSFKSLAGLASSQEGLVPLAESDQEPAIEPSLPQEDLVQQAESDQEPVIEPSLQADIGEVPVSEVETNCKDLPSVSITVGESNVRSKIIIVDSVDKDNFKSSRDILKEIHNFAPDLLVDQAYFLAKGGIAIYLFSVEDRDILFEVLPVNPFGGVKKKLGISTEHQVYIKKVPFSYDIQEVSKALNDQEIPVSSLSRIISSNTGRPTQSLKLITTSKSAAITLIERGLLINENLYTVEKKKVNLVTRCFNCQRFGHIWKHCSAQRRCVRCSLDHSPLSCSNSLKCSNCEGAHVSSSLLCPIYINHHEHFAGEHTVAEYVNRSAKFSSRQA